MADQIAKKISIINKNKHVFEILYLLSLAALIIYLWNHTILYPLKLLVVFFHEISHALATVLTGGSVQEVVVVPQQGGYVLSQGGNHFIILNSGYLGSLIWGVLIYSLSSKRTISKFIMISLGLTIGLVTFFFISNLFAFIFGLVLMIVMILIGKFLPSAVNNFGLRLIGLTSMIYVPLDILSDTIFRSHLKSDARILAEEFGGATILWGGLWLIVSVGLIFYFLYRSVIMSKKRESI